MVPGCRTKLQLLWLWGVQESLTSQLPTSATLGPDFLQAHRDTELKSITTAQVAEGQADRQPLPTNKGEPPPTPSSKRGPSKTLLPPE